MNRPSKISNFDVSSRWYQNIFRLDVSVNDLTIMASLKCTGNLIYIFGAPRKILWISSRRKQLLLKFTLAHQIFRVFGPAVLERVLPLQRTPAPRKLACHQQNTSTFGGRFHAYFMWNKLMIEQEEQCIENITWDVTGSQFLWWAVVPFCVWPTHFWRSSLEQPGTLRFFPWRGTHDQTFLCQEVGQFQSHLKTTCHCEEDAKLIT